MSIVIGLTATPCDGEGKGLPWYKAMVEAASFSDLIATGRLVDIPDGNVFCPYRPDLTGAKTSGGDYSGNWLQERMDRSHLVGDIVTEWKKHGQDRPTVVFCSGVQHSIHVAESFNGQGVTAEHIDGTTPQEERDEVFAGIQDGRTRVVTNCAVLDRGWDCPHISCGILAKPTKRLRSYTQMIGRLIRSHPGKTDAILIDHAGAVFQHGWPTEDRLWSLDADERIEDRELEQKDKEKKPREPYCCPECACMWENGHKCPNCGFQHRKRGKQAITIDGELVTVKRKEIKKASTKTDPQKLWHRLLGMCANTGRKYSQAAVIFRSNTGSYPEQAGVGPLAGASQRGMKVAAIWPGYCRRKASK